MSEHFSQEIGITYHNDGDEMPTRHEGRGRANPRRNKLVHQQGAVAKVEFIPSDDTPYTGIFQGSKHAVMRISDADLFIDGAKDSDGQKFKQKHIQPSIAVKFLRDTVRSANYLGMVGFND